MRVSLTVLAIALMASFAYASPEYLTSFESTYPAAAGSRIDVCLLCHVYANPDAQGTSRNSYGTAWRSGGRNFANVQNADSDGDGFTNLAEITAKTFPGNANDKPAPTTGSVTVTLGPAGAVTAGAQWRAGAGAWQNSGATVPNLAVGSVTINFKAVTGWNTPIDQSVTITGGGTASTAGTYTQIMITIPNVAGQTQSAASAALTSSNLVLGQVSQQCSDTVPAGSVISTTPPVGSSVAYGSVVALLVSSGPCPVTVPNVVGQTQSSASTAIVGANLVVGTITQEYNSQVPAGTVFDQSPLAGSPVAPGTAVLLWVSKGPQPVITGSVIINKGAYATNSLTLALLVTWSSNAVRMRFSDNGTTWTAWESVHPNKAYTLPAGDGYKTVRVQFMDIANNRSVTYSDYILVDTTLPTGSILINNNAKTTAGTEVTLNLTYADTGSGIRSMRFSNDGATWSVWEAVAAAKAWTLAGPAGYNTVRVQYRDAAGNYSAVYNDYILYQPI